MGTRRTAALALTGLLLGGCSGTTHPIAPAASSPTVAAATPRPTPTSPRAPTARPALRLDTDWPTYHLDAARRGYMAGPEPLHSSVAWRAGLDGKVYASPLVVGGRVIAATENGSLYALDGTSGRVLWRRHLAAPVAASSLPCGNIDPVGITGTPAYDAVTRQIFAVATTGAGTHLLAAVDVATGALRSSAALDAPGSVPSTQLQRAALLIANRKVYVAFGGNYGDCGAYFGRVAAVPIAGGVTRWFAVPTRREGGIWGASGPAATPSGQIVVTTGNGQASGGAWDHSDSVLVLSPDLVLQDGFAPSGWAQENSADADLGSTGPVLLPGGGQVVAAGKGGSVYLVDVARPGGVGGQLSQLGGCASYGGAAAAPGSAGTDVYLPCAGGLLQVHVTGKTLSRGWQAPPSITGSPLIGGSTVWTVQQDGTLDALATSTGRLEAQLSVGPVSRFATPALSGNVLLVPTLLGITAVRVAP